MPLPRVVLLNKPHGALSCFRDFVGRTTLSAFVKDASVRGA
jgi:16S rRNA U516 pseudouridylate synthase RsuA-like enzyme